MTTREWKRCLIVGGLALTLATAPAWAGDRKPARSLGTDLWGTARAFLSELLTMARLAPPPRLEAVAGDDGPYIDPNGLRLANPAACAPAAPAAGPAKLAGDDGGCIGPNG